MSQRRHHEKIENILIDRNKTTTYQYLWNSVKSELRGKFITNSHPFLKHQLIT